MENLILSHKRGIFLENFASKIFDVQVKSDTCLRNAAQTIYLNHLLRRKCTVLCKNTK